MALRESSSEESKQVAEAEETEEEEEEEPPCPIDPRLADAVQHPQFRSILLRMEAKIQQVMVNPDLLEVEFLQCSSSRLRMLAGKLALHYGLEPHCNEGIRVFARKKPDSRIPSFTLRGIPKFNPEDKPTNHIKKHSGGASSSNLSAPETNESEKKARTLEEREEEKPMNNLSAPDMTEPENTARTLEERKEEKPTNNLSAPEMTEPEKRAGTLEENPPSNLSASGMTETKERARTLEDMKEEKQTNNLSAPEMTEPEKRAGTLEENPPSNLSASGMTETKERARTLEDRKEEKPTNNLSAPETTQPEKRARTLEERKEEKPTSNFSAPDTIEPKKRARTLEERKEEKPTSNFSASETTEPEERPKTLEERKEEKPPTSIDPRLAHAVLHPKFRKILLSMETKIQQVIQNPNLQEVEFPQCSSSHLRALAGMLALHYGLEPHCTEGIRVFARKSPDSRIPSVTLSGIPNFNTEDKLTIPIKKRSGGTSSSNLSAPEMTEPEKRARTLEEDKRTSNLSAPEMIEPEKRARTLEERKEEKLTSDFTAPETTEPEKRIRTLEDRKEEKPTSNLSAAEMTEPEKRARTLEERKEEKYPTFVDPRLVEAAQHPKFRKILLSMEAKLQEVVQNPNLQEVEFPQCNSSYLRALAGALALHYGLEPHCTKGIEVFSRKKPDSRIPSVTLSRIPKFNSEERLAILMKKRSGDASSSNLSAQGTTKPEKRPRTSEERGEEEEKPPTLVDPRLANAVRHPQFRKILLSMEAKIQEVIQNPNLQEVEFPQCSSSHLRKLAGMLALHYGLEPHCTEGIRVFARKKPDSRIPSVILSDITKYNPKDKPTILIKTHSGGASSSNLSAQGMTEPEKRPRTLDEREVEQQPVFTIDPCLAEAVQHSQFRRTLLYMESKVQQLMLNPNQEVEFLYCSSPPLRALACLLALHYGLEPHCTERKVLARKTPDSKIPYVTLSGIPEVKPGDRLFIWIKKRRGGTLSRNLSAPDMRVKTLAKRKENYYKARQRIFNEPAPLSSISPVVSSSISAVVSSSMPVVSRSTSPVVSRSIPPAASSSISPVVSSSIPRVVSNSISPVVSSSISSVVSSSIPLVVSSSISPVVSSSISAAVSNSIHLLVSSSVSTVVPNSIPPMGSSSISPVVSSSISPVVSRSMSPVDSRSTSPVVSRSTSPVVSNSIPPVVSSSISAVVSTSIPAVVSQDSLSGRHAVTNPMHNPGSDLNSNSNSSMNGRGMGQFHHGPMTSQQPQQIQYGDSVSQPALNHHIASASPNMLTPYGNYAVYYPYYASGAPYNLAYSSYTQWPPVQYTQPYYESRGLYHPAYSSYTEWPLVQYTQPYYFSGYNPRYSNFTQWPPVQYMQPYYANGVLYNPAYSSYMQWPSVQYTQQFSQEPMQYQRSISESESLQYGTSTSQSYQQPWDSIFQNNQSTVNTPNSRQADETLISGRGGLNGRLGRGLTNRDRNIFRSWSI